MQNQGQRKTPEYKRVTDEARRQRNVMLDFGCATFAYVDATYCVLSSKGPRMEFYGESGVINLGATLEEPAIEVFQWDRARELRNRETTISPTV